MTKTYNFANADTGADAVIPVANFPLETRIQFQLKSGQSVRLAKDRDELLADQISGVSGGIEITQAMGIVELWWIGPMFARADSNGAVMTHMIQGCRANGA